MKPAFPSVQQFFSGVVVYHIAAAVRPFVQYVGIPLFSCLGVVSKVDGSGPVASGINTVDHSTNHKGIGYRVHCFCVKEIDGLELSWIQCFLRAIRAKAINSASPFKLEGTIRYP